MSNEQRYTTDGLAEYLKERGIKQRWLAEQVGVYDVLVSRWVHGTTPIRSDHAEQVARILGVPFSFLFAVPNGTESDSSEAA